jgi:thiol-disulfide isomerase/thioredoxin
LKQASEYAPGSDIQKGKSVPAFEVAALQPDEEAYIHDSFEGTYVLIDFWIPWCAPCYGELPHLREAQAQHGDNLTILSVSLAGTRVSVESTVNEYEMPWEHAIAKEGFDSRIAEQFNVVRIPKPILIGPEGDHPRRRTLSATRHDAP